MNTNSNLYTYMYAAIITVISAVLLAVSAEGLKPAQEANILLEKKMNVLNAVRFKSTDRNTIEDSYKKYITPVVVDSKGEVVQGRQAFDIVLKDEAKKALSERSLPLYIYTGDDGKKYYIFPMFGAGLWGPVWGFISVEGTDFNTIYGSFFDHKGETPGLGAEIAADFFQASFFGKKLFDKQQKFVSVRVMKKGTSLGIADEQDHRVDGISGGTITSNAVDEMILKNLEQYLLFFEKEKSLSGESESPVSNHTALTDTSVVSNDSLQTGMETVEK